MAATWRNAVSMLPQILIFGSLLLIIGVFKISFAVAIISLFFLILINRLFLTLMNKSTNK